MLSLLGAAGERIGYDRWLKANTVKRRTHSLFRQGLMLYHHLPNWPDDRIRPLMETFGRDAPGTAGVSRGLRCNLMLETKKNKGMHEAPDRALGASDGLLGLPMDASGAGRLNRLSPSCLNRSAQRIDFFHGLLVVCPSNGFTHRCPWPTGPRPAILLVPIEGYPSSLRNLNRQIISVTYH